MEKMDNLYREVIAYLFNINLKTVEELDDFYKNIDKHLSYEDMELLQSEMMDVLHKGLPSLEEVEDAELSLEEMIEVCPKIGKSKELGEIII